MGWKHTFLLQLVENVVRADRVAGVTQSPPRIAEPDLNDARSDAELELIMQAVRSPLLDSILIGRRASNCFKLRMAIEHALGQTVDPVLTFTDLAVWDVR